MHALLAACSALVGVACASAPRTDEGHPESPSPEPAPPQAAQTRGPASPQAPYLLLARGELVEVHLAPELYRADRPESFFVRVRITNRTDRTLGVDLRDPWRVVYPNQWGWSDSEQRLEINERRLAPRPIDHEALRAAHREGQLASLAARASLDYLRLFDSAGPEQPSQPRGRFLLLSLDGVLCATDGQRVDALTWWSTGDGAPRSEVALSPPTQLSDPPAGVLVVGPRRR